jgi:hypothetical protein
LNEVPREAPGPEWQSPIADRVEAESAHLVDEKIGADKIVAPVFEEDGDAQVILLTPTMINDPGERINRLPPGLSIRQQRTSQASKFLV